MPVFSRLGSSLKRSFGGKSDPDHSSERVQRPYAPFGASKDSAKFVATPESYKNGIKVTTDFHVSSARLTDMEPDRKSVV